MALNKEKFLQKYYVHPESIAFFKNRSDDGVRPYYEIGVEAARQESFATSLKYGGMAEFWGEEEELCVPSPFTADGIPITVYRYKPQLHGTPPVLLVYFHGGGNVIGCRQSHATVCKILARDTPCIVVNVEYRLAPEHKFPANHDDAKCVVEWVSINKTTLGGGPASKLGVSGDSAGGRIAATVCHEVKNVIDFAVLVYPGCDHSKVYPSMEEFTDGPVLSKLIRQWFNENHFNNEEDTFSVRASPMLNKDFSYLPPTLIVVAELDPLRDACYAYYDKLKKAGVLVEMITIKGVPHSFWSLPKAFKETCNEAHSTAVKFIQKQKDQS